VVAVNDDPVLARRAQVTRLVRAGQRIGYGALLVAMVAFFVGAATGFPRAAVGAVITALVVSCVTLPAAIVFGYAVRAAEREERGEPPGH
jgi:hypothetical protein